MKVERTVIEDQDVYEIIYFSPVEVGNERYKNQLYFQTDIYTRTWPVSFVDKMTAQITNLRNVEVGMFPCDEVFMGKHRQAVLFHCKMALAYLDAREARIALKLCEMCLPSTKSSLERLMQDPAADFDFLRITILSVLACAARRVKLYQKALAALSEAKDVCMAESDHNRVHPLMIALTLLNLSAVLGDLDHDEQALRWGLEALSMMYAFFSKEPFPDAVKNYYLALGCHNAALHNVKQGKWADAVELVNEGIEFTKSFGEGDDGLRGKLIAIGAQAKHVPEKFLSEAVNALNGWGDERETWNLSFWDAGINEVLEEIHVLKHTKTLKHLIIDNLKTDAPRYPQKLQDIHLAHLINAIVSCESLSEFTIAGIDFDPKKVWRRIKKPGFLETSWYGSVINYTSITTDERPQMACYRRYFKNLDTFTTKVMLFLIILGNECEGVDLSENGIDAKTVTALVRALHHPDRPVTTREVSMLALRDNCLDEAAAHELAKCFEASSAMTPDDQSRLALLPTPASVEIKPTAFATHSKSHEAMGIIRLDISENKNLGDGGFESLVAGISQSIHFKELYAQEVGLGPRGCTSLRRLATTSIAMLDLSRNSFGSEGAKTLCEAVAQFRQLHTLLLDGCGVDASGASPLAALLSSHTALRHVNLSHNKFRDVGVISLCKGVAKSCCLESLHLAYCEIFSEGAADAIGDMMRKCESLKEINLSGNHIDAAGAPSIGSAIERSKVLTMNLEDMGFTESTIDVFLDHGVAETQDLQVMVLSKNPIGDDGLAVIAECLSIGLVELSLSKCALTTASHATLLNLVSLSPNLMKLDLSHNNLGPLGCSDMVSWMTQNEKETYSLRCLELGYCNLGDEGLLQMLPVLSSLTHLGMQGNGITSAGLEAVMHAPALIQLKSLDLADNAIGESGLHALTERFQQETKRSLWNPAQLTSTIDQVILTNNDISPGLASSTEVFVKIHNPLLTVVW